MSARVREEDSFPLPAHLATPPSNGSFLDCWLERTRLVLWLMLEGETIDVGSTAG